MSGNYSLTDLTARITKIRFVNTGELREMFLLKERYFTHTDYHVFEKDFLEKDWVIVLQKKDTSIFGFSTIQQIETKENGNDELYLFSGDTIVDMEFWQANMLIPAFGFFMLKCINDFPGRKIYWYLISKGFRTYRLLPVFFKKYYPSHKEDAPPEYRARLDYISIVKFNGNYNPVTGIISFPGQKDCLTKEMAEIPESKRRNSSVRFFLKKNPFYMRGDELACIAEVSRENLTPLANRVMENRTVEWVE
ncbi:MAG: hypothetical protein JXB88_17565 [Spirochaetales bacterium]|nr:hypothetical protein [Spirochaetales bacterium]